MYWLTSLNTNGAAVAASSSMAMVVVTTVYVVLTLLLWRTTTRQAEITRQAFETSYRPYVSVKSGSLGQHIRQWAKSWGASRFTSFSRIMGRYPLRSRRGRNEAPLWISTGMSSPSQIA